MGYFEVNELKERYFFLYPAGQTGLTAVTFLINLPLTQVIVIFFAAAALAAAALAAAALSAAA